MRILSSRARSLVDDILDLKICMIIMAILDVVVWIAFISLVAWVVMRWKEII